MHKVLIYVTYTTLADFTRRITLSGEAAVAFAAEPAGPLRGPHVTDHDRGLDPITGSFGNFRVWVEGFRVLGFRGTRQSQ